MVEAGGIQRGGNLVGEPSGAPPLEPGYRAARACGPSGLLQSQPDSKWQS